LFGGVMGRHHQRKRARKKQHDARKDERGPIAHTHFVLL
jgi:hypothetical protein